MSSKYVPSFYCEYCGQSRPSIVDHAREKGIFVPCQCKEARKHRDQEHYLMMERRKQARRKQR